VDPQRPPRPVTIGYVNVTALLGVTLAGGVHATVWAAVGAVRGGHSIRRPRQFGWLIMLGYPVVAFISSLLNEGLGSTMAAEQPLLGSEFDPHLSIALPTGLAVLVLAEVFAHGVRLREDIEGTI